MAVERVERASRVGDCVNLWAVLKEHLAESVSERFDVSECMAAFSTAVDENRVAVAAIFLDHGVKINTAHVRAATEKKHCEMLQLFLDHGWDINQPLGRLSPPALE